MKTQVLYKSRTGNTEKLAKAIFEAVPGQCKDIAPLEGQTDYEMGDVYFIGFWTDRGSASVEVLDYLGSLQGKMPISVREKYLSMKTKENTKMINAMLRNFDMAMLHPDTQDLEGAKAFVKKVFEDIRKEELQYE